MWSFLDAGKVIEEDRPAQVIVNGNRARAASSATCHRWMISVVRRPGTPALRRCRINQPRRESDVRIY